MSYDTKTESNDKAELLGKIVGNLLWNIGCSYWLLLAINTLFDKDYPYDFVHIISMYFFVQLTERFISKK